MPDYFKAMDLLKSVKLSYDEIEVFTEMSLTVPVGGITCIVGPSGCGKTSILNLLAGLTKPIEGLVDVHDETVGYIFQEDRLLPWETVYDNVRLVREVNNTEEIMALLEALELKAFAFKYPDQLSGGMRQRCALARGFYYHSTLLLMDEPFKSLDYDLRLSLGRYLVKLWQQNKNTVVFVTHDIDEALLLGHQVIVLSKRPAVIKNIFRVHSAIEQRNLLNKEHVTLRGQIIDLMTDRKRSPDE